MGRDSQTARRGQPASTHACSSATRHIVDRPIRIGRGTQPAESQAHHVRVDFPHIFAASLAGISRKGGVNSVSIMASGTSDETSKVIPLNEHSHPEFGRLRDRSGLANAGENYGIGAAHSPGSEVVASTGISSCIPTTVSHHSSEQADSQQSWQRASLLPMESRSSNGVKHSVQIIRTPAS